jgi:hypothetical protein
MVGIQIQTQFRNRTIVNTTSYSEALERDDSWRRWLALSCELSLVVFAAYFASVGPAFRMYLHRDLSYRSLALYQPLMSIHSPLYRFSRRYVVMWM